MQGAGFSTGMSFAEVAASIADAYTLAMETKTILVDFREGAEKRLSDPGDA